MKKTHHYTLGLSWTGDKNEDSIKNDRLYEVSVPGKLVFKGSADGVFHGDSSLLNPEDLLMSALSSCHMMSYFYVCRKNKLKIISYEDNPLGELELKMDGSGSFRTVDLNPVVTIRNEKEISLAKALHLEAKKLCFIANSCCFEIVVNPTVIVL